MGGKDSKHKKTSNNQNTIGLATAFQGERETWPYPHTLILRFRSQMHLN